MATWGYVIKDIAGNRLFEELGYETEADAKEYGRLKKEESFPKTFCFVKTEQNWEDIQEV